MTAETESLRINQIDLAVPLQDTSHCLEFFLVSLHQCFQLTLQQTAGLLTQGGKYLAHVLINGLNGHSDPVIAWYDTLQTHAPHLAALIQAEAANGSVQFLLSALKPGFISHYAAVAQACCRVYTILAEFLDSTQCWEWLVSEAGGLECVWLACRRHGVEVKSLVVDLIVRYSLGQFATVFTVNFKQMLEDPLDYLTAMNEFLEPLCHVARPELENSGVVDYWIELTMQLPDNSNDLQLAAVNFLADLWILLPEQVDESLAERILSALRKAHRERSSVVKAACLGKLFHLLTVFTERRSAYAPAVYKSLAFTFVENYKELASREFMLANFMLIFQAEASIPVEVVVDPLIKQLQVNPDLTLSILDFDFFNVVVQHPQLSVSSALQVIDVLGRICAQQLEFSHIASNLFIGVLNQFKTDQPIREYLVRFVQYACQLVTALVRQRLSKEAVTAALATPELTELKFLLLQRNAVLDLVTQVLLLKIPRLTPLLLKEIVKTAVVLRRVQSKHNPAMLALLATQGEPLSFIEQFERGELETLETPAKRPIRKVPSLSTKAVARSRVLDDLAKARQRSQQRMAALRSKTEHEVEEYPRVQLRKRLAAVNVVTERPVFAKEPEEHSPMLALLVKRYRKALTDLFKQYSSTGYTSRSPVKSSIALIVDNKLSLSVGEFYRMLKDHGVSTSQMSLEAATSLIREFCHNQKRSLKLEFSDFVNLIIQTACYIFSKPPVDLSLLPPEAALQTLISQFRKYRQLQGMSTTAYDEPHPGFGDREVVHRLNQMLLRTPHAEVPKGFKKVKECEVEVQYRSPARVPVSTAVCLELVDELLHAVFGVHILEPQLQYSVAYRAKGVLPKIEVRQADERNAKLSDQYYMNGVGMVYHSAKYEATLPAELDVSPVLKFEIARLSNKYELDTLVEIGKALDDVLYSVQKHSTILLRKGDKPKFANRAVALRAEAQQLAEEQRKARERKRLQRVAEVEHQIQTANEERIAFERANRPSVEKEMRRAQEQRRLAEAWEEEVKARKAERVRQWRLARAAEFQQRLRCASLEHEETEEQKKLRLRQFLKQEQTKLRDFFKKVGGKRSTTPSPLKGARRTALSRSEAAVRKSFRQFF